MRLFALSIFALLAAPLLMGAGKPAPAHHLVVGDADRAALDAISAYLNGITTLKGAFIQIGPDGNLSQGAFYISKPGKMRFEYKPPSPTLIVADGETVAVANIRLNTVDRYPLSQTPLDLVLGNDIDLKNDPQIVDLTHQQGSIVIGARTTSTMTRPNIMLVFSEPQYELRQWSVVDNQGLTTTVALRGAVSGGTLSPLLFRLPDKNPFARHPQD